MEWTKQKNDVQRQWKDEANDEKLIKKEVKEVKKGN